MYRYLENGNSLKLDKARCTACGICIEVCPHAVFALVDAPVPEGPKGEKKSSRAVLKVVSAEACMECGACSLNCPFGALSVRRGVGCAIAVWNGLRRGTEPNCDCSEGDCC